MAAPMAPSMLRAGSSTMVRLKSKDCSSHNTMDMSRIRVPAFTRKPFTFSHTWRMTLEKEGRR